MASLSGSDVSTLRRINASALLELLYTNTDRYTVTQLARLTGLSRPTVEAAIAELVSQGLVREVERATNRVGAGRPARRYEFVAEDGVIVAIDLGPHGVSVAVADLRGEILDIATRPDTDLSSGRAAWSMLESALTDVLNASSKSDHHVRAIAIGIPAIVGLDGKIALTTVVPDWLDFGLIDRVRARFERSVVFVENDAKLATLAELEWGEAVGVRNALVILIGRRLAAGVIVNGRLAKGAHGGAGEIGALRQVGWTSAYAKLVEGDADAQSRFAAAAEGDVVAAAAIRVFAQDLATGVAALSLIIDPERVVLQGGIAGAGEALLQPLRAALTPMVLFEPDLVVSKIGDAAVLRGALARAREHVTTQLLSIDLGEVQADP